MAPAGVSVTAADLDTVLRVVHDCAEAPDLASLRERMLLGVRSLVPCDVAILNEVDPRTGHWDVSGDPADVLFPEYVEVLLRHTERHPLMRHQLRTGDGRARTISDFTTRRGFLRQDTEDSVYSRIGLEDTLAIAFPGMHDVVGIALSDRWERFGDRDRAVLDLIRPHLGLAWRAVSAGPLTPRELEVLRLVADGRTDGQIATALRIRRRTVSKHLEHVYEKLGVQSRTAAAHALAIHLDAPFGAPR
ncbi:helix-turn-helix transcriptional regulator [Phycicoccus sp.]|uniref:response regulator transcription factor n=1 Tax=Phycicoccus sp. TaxID=1902410 RepID=UPI002C44FA62|nr:helix-turn-helix transcriptional regulator [Phycicoccus sp.]HMM97354.1 helix-turn-helix transcriptional regulator [Phycicoccus sp.]